MKSNDEMVASLFSRRDEYQREKAKKKKLYIKAGASAAAVLTAVTVGFFVFPGGTESPKTPMDEMSVTDKSDVGDTGSGKSDVGDTGSGNLPCIPIPSRSSIDTSDASAFVPLYGKHVSHQLLKNLENAKDTDVFGVICHPEIDMSYTVGGKSLKTLSQEADNERALTQKLYSLLKMGDYLKYGTGEAPDGTRMDKNFYEEETAYYGKEILDKYIVGGEFLSDRVKADIEKLEKCIAEQKYKEARYEYLCHLVKNIPSEYADGEPYAIGKDSDCICIFFSKVSFRDFSPDGVENWYFDNIIPEIIPENAATEAGDYYEKSGVTSESVTGEIAQWN